MRDEVSITDLSNREESIVDGRPVTPPGYERRHGQTERNGTWEALADPSRQVGMREESSYKETKSKEVGRVADEAIVLLMSR